MSVQKDAMFTNYNDFYVALKRHEEECGVLYVTCSSKKLRKESQLVDTLKYEHAKFGSSQYDCTINSCSCDFFIKFCLPCRHIFSLRSELCLPLYHCGNERFKCTAAVCLCLTSNDHHNITHEVLPARKANTPESRYHITKEITKDIESLLPLLGEQAFQSAVSQLERVLTLIKADRPVAVIDHSQGDIILPTQPETENLNAGVTASSPPPSVSSNTSNNLDVVVLPSLSPPPPSVSSNSLDVVVLPSLSLLIALMLLSCHLYLF